MTGMCGAIRRSLTSHSDRGTPHGAVESRQVRPQTFQFHEPVNRPQQVVRLDVVLQREGIEQGRLIDPPLTIITLPPASTTRVNQPPPPVAIADFFNGIGVLRTFACRLTGRDELEAP